VVRRHHLYPGAARVPVPGRDHGLATRHVLAWRLSNTLDARFCLEALHAAMAEHGKPEMFNTDQGSQGEFKRSSQHLDEGGCDEHSKAAPFGSIWAGAIVVTRSTAGGGTR
jgi:putative transposase